MMNLIKRVAIPLAGILFWVAVPLAGAQIFGANEFLLIAIIACICVLVFRAMIGLIRKKRLDKLLNAALKSNSRHVIFHGAATQATLAFEVAKSCGWVGEVVSDAKPNLVDVCFRPSDGASPVRQFLEALFEAELVQNIDSGMSA